jgi:protein-tyrosine phosphatase
MIDIHSHPLWEADDGAESFEIAVEMCKIAAGDGITHMVATPHSNYRYPFDPDANQRKLAELQQAVGDTPRMLLGCDFHLSYENIRQLLDRVHNFFTINQTTYLLVELDEHFIPQQLDQVFYDMQMAGFTPIITHPERNTLLRRKTELLSKWVSQGCLVQVTAQSYVGRFGSQAQALSEEWMSQNLVHFFATDAHDANYRPPILSTCYEKIVADHGEAAAMRLLMENPEAVIKGCPLPPGPTPVPPPEPKKRGWLATVFSRPS